MKDLLLSASATVNALLLIAVALPGATPPQSAPQAAVAERTAESACGRDRPAMLVRSLAAAAERSPLAADYWLRSPDALSEHALARAAAHDAARAELVERCGEQIRDDPVFAVLFRPLEERFGFLSSAQQIAVQRLRLEFAGDVAAAQTGVMHGRSVAAPPSDRYDRFVAELSAVLGPQAAREYQLRESPLASQLRASGTRLDADRFRAAFAALQTLEQPDVSRAAFAAARQRLRDLLGDRGFNRLSAGRDARFAAVQAAGARLGLDTAQIESAYAVLNDAQDGMLRALGDERTDPAERGRLARELRDERQRRLAELVGATAATALIAAAERA